LTSIGAVYLAVSMTTGVLPSKSLSGNGFRVGSGPVVGS
jgi:hypothetical protein